MHKPDFTVRVEIPDLKILVEYLREKDINQSQVDALAKTATSITARLLTSSKALKEAVASQSQGE